jgi:PhnB protein
MAINPYLMFNGRCEEAFRFYAESLHGKIMFTQRFGDSGQNSPPGGDPNQIMHISMQVHGSVLMGSDCPPSHATDYGDNIHLSLNYEDEKTQTQQFEALARGGEVMMPLQDTFWGARFGMIKDRFGFRWMSNFDKNPDKK